MADGRWATSPAVRSLVLALRKEDIVVATRAANYATEFRAFLSAFGSTFDAGSAA